MNVSLELLFQLIGEQQVKLWLLEKQLQAKAAEKKDAGSDSQSEGT